jgi:type I restriction enzyme S subunit
MNNNNTTYKDSLLGKIPWDWELKQLGDLTVKIGSGITPKGGEKVYKSTGKPFIRSQNVGWGSLILDDIVFIDEGTHKSFQSTEIKDGDVFLNITGASIGRSAVSVESVKGGNVNQHVCIIRPDRNLLNPGFLNSFLLSIQGQKLIDSYQAGGNRQGLNFEQIKSFKIALPPLPEQKTIAHVLGLMDSAINTNNRLIAQKELQKKWLMHQLLSEKFIVKNEKWCKSGIRKVIIGEIAKINMGQSPNSVFYTEIKEGLPLIQGNADLKNRLSIERIFTTHITKTCDQGDIIMTVRAPVGTIGIATKRSCIGRGVCAFKPKNVDSSYFYYLMLNYEETWKRLEQGSTFTAVNSTDIFHFSLFIINSIEEQTAIVRVLLSADKEISLLKSKTEKLREQKKGLMQVLLTGKKRIVIKDRDLNN